MEKEVVQMGITGKKNIGALPALYPTPIVLCGTYDEQRRPNASAIAWIGICSRSPPAIQVSIRKSRHTYHSILERRAFTVNIPSTKDAEAADFCGLVSGDRYDKFTSAGLTPKRGQFVDAPIVDEFPVCMECRLMHVFEIGSHDMFVGEIMASWVNESCLEPDGSVNVLKVSPLVFAPGEGYYYSLGASVGRAFSIGKAMMEAEE